MGDGMCNGDLNNAECGYDEGDCDYFNAKYPNCDVFFPFLIGDGYRDDDLDVRHLGKNYNTLECKYDGRIHVKMFLRMYFEQSSRLRSFLIFLFPFLHARNNRRL